MLLSRQRVKRVEAAHRKIAEEDRTTHREVTEGVEAAHREVAEGVEAAWLVLPRVDEAILVDADHRLFVVDEAEVNERRFVLAEELGRDALADVAVTVLDRYLQQQAGTVIVGAAGLR